MHPNSVQEKTKPGGYVHGHISCPTSWTKLTS